MGRQMSMLGLSGHQDAGPVSSLSGLAMTTGDSRTAAFHLSSLEASCFVRCFNQDQGVAIACINDDHAFRSRQQ